MATLDELTEQTFQPLDINTPIVDRVGNPTPAFKQQQRSFRKVLITQSKNTNAAIIQEGEVRAEADNASALLVDTVTAEALGFTAAILMKAEVGINPAGVLARYQIVASLDPGGGLVQTGMYFDIVEDVLNPGDYLGKIHLDADKVTMGRVDQAGMFPFRLEAGVVYIETAVIKSLSIGTSKMSVRAITDVTVAFQSGAPVGPSSTILAQGVPVADPASVNGVLVDFIAFMDRPTLDSGNVGYWRVLLYRNGVVIGATPAMFYDDNFAYPVPGRWFDPAPGIDPAYTIGGEVLTGPGNFTIDGGVAIFTLLKR